MPGPISTNAQFNQVGHDNILRDIEQLYLLIPQSTGDLGKQPIQASDMSDNGANRQNGLTSGGATTPGATVHYLGTLDLPIFGGSNTVAGNAAGTGAVDWQQVRSAANFVASGAYATIIGGRDNIAGGDYAVSGGFGSSAGGTQSVSFNATVSGNYSVGMRSSAALGLSVTGTESIGFGHSFPSGISGYRCFSIRSSVSGNDVFAWESDYVIPWSKCVMLRWDDMSTTAGSSNVTNVFFHYPKDVNDFFGVNLGAVAGAAFNIGFVHASSFYLRSTTDSMTGVSLFNSKILTGTTGTTSALRAFSANSKWSGSNVTSSFTDLFLANSTLSSATGGTSTFVAAINSNVEVNGLSNVVAINLGTSFSFALPTSNVTYIGGGGHGTYTPVANDNVFYGTIFSTGGFGCNDKAPQGTFACGAALAAAPGVYGSGYAQGQSNLINNIRLALIANGICV